MNLFLKSTARDTTSSWPLKLAVSYHSNISSVLKPKHRPQWQSSERKISVTPPKLTVLVPVQISASNSLASPCCKRPTLYFPLPPKMQKVREQWNWLALPQQYNYTDYNTTIFWNTTFCFHSKAEPQSLTGPGAATQMKWLDMQGTPREFLYHARCHIFKFCWQKLQV